MSKRKIWLNEFNEAFYSSQDYSQTWWADGPFEIAIRGREPLSNCKFKQIDEDIYECERCHKVIVREGASVAILREVEEE